MNAIKQIRNFGMVAMYFVSNIGRKGESDRQISAEEQAEERELVRVLEQLKRMERRRSGCLSDPRSMVSSTTPTPRLGCAEFAG